MMGSTFFNGRYKDYLKEEKEPIKETVVKEEPEMTDEEWAAMYEPGGKMYIEPENEG